MPKFVNTEVTIAIPSYGRAFNTSRFCTFRHISTKHQSNTVVYVEPEEKTLYRRNYSGFSYALASNADKPKSWGSIMDLIIDQEALSCETLIIMDDDLALAVRPELPEHPTKFIEMDERWFNKMIDDLCEHTSPECPLVSGQYRQFSQGKKELLQHNQRISMIWALNSEFFVDHPEFRFYRPCQLPFMTDYYFFLALLKEGHPNLCLNSYTKDDKPNAEGGESSKRTVENMNYSARKLAEMFPGYVHVYEKKGKGNWRDGMPGVRIMASKLYKDSIKKARR